MSFSSNRRAVIYATSYSELMTLRKRAYHIRRLAASRVTPELTPTQSV